PWGREASPMASASEPAAVAPLGCYTRALKNAQYLRARAPDQFAGDPAVAGFGTGVPIDILRVLHRIRPDSPELSQHEPLADFLRRNQLPAVGNPARNPLFSGTIYFAQITFRVSSG